MKKVIAKTIALLAVFGMISGSAMAAGPIEVYKDDDVVTIKVSSLENGEETSLLVTKADATISQAFADTTKVQHIDQVAADENGVSTFTFTYAGSEKLTVYSGYATMSATDTPYDTVIDESTPPTPGSGFTLGDVNGDATINVTDVAAIIQHVVNDAPFQKNENGVMVDYAEGAQAADVNKSGDINVTDVSKIISYIVNDEPF